MLDAAVIDPIELLNRDLRGAAVSLTDAEARYLVDYYYLQQENRKRSDAQVRTMSDNAEPSALVQWLARNDRVFEHNIQRALDAWTDSKAVGVWSKSILGIGPVIAAGLLANIDVTKAPTVGHIWRFAGLDPTTAWAKGEKRPWNARLKTLCWKIGESFVKVQNNDKDTYGHLMLAYKERIAAKNSAHEYADAAKQKLEKYKIGKDTEAYGWYAQGLLPPAHVHARAKRYAVKLFLSHWHHVAYVEHYHTEPPKPYILTEAGGHAHFMGPPNY